MHEEAGSVYVFGFDGASWIEEARLRAPVPLDGDDFGRSISTFGNRVLIWAPGDFFVQTAPSAAYVFAFNGTSWIVEAELVSSPSSQHDDYGISVSLVADRALIGRYNGSTHGAKAVVFDFDGTTWNQVAILSVRGSTHFFGRDVALSEDRAIIGDGFDSEQGTIAGAAYILDLRSTGLTVTCAPVSPPVIVPAGGGSYTYDLGITNNSASSETFDIWIDIVGPGVSRTLGPATRTLAAGAQRSHTPNQNVPGSVPTGAYTHTCNVGAFPVADASAGFDWEKSAAMAPGEPNVIDWTTEAEFVAALGAHTSPDGRRPTSFSLQPAYPNPFNPSTTIRFSLPERVHVELKVFDRLGREVARLVDGTIEAGRHEVRFSGSSLPSGVYFARFSAGGFAQTRRLTLLK